MAIKYVEDSRKNKTTGADLSDTETIQTAIDGLEDGDTLIFEQGRTYVLDKPVSFTSYDATTMTGTTRNYVTIDGNGCTVAGSDTFIETYGYTSGNNNNKNALFYISDEMKNGMKYSTIKNFNFKWKTAITTTDYNTKKVDYRNVGLGVVTPDYENAPSGVTTYFANGLIENCTFEGFGRGLYQCGEHTVVKGCHFKTCYIGLDSDGSVFNVFEHNYFFTTKYTGLHLNMSYNSTACNNRFYKCEQYSIYVGGTFESSSYDKSVYLTITDNKIYGRYADTLDDNVYTVDGETIQEPRYVQDIGIKLQGVQNAIVTRNHITGISRDKESMDEQSDVLYGYGYGHGILVDGNFNIYNDRVCLCKRGIITNNYISDCYGHGIRIKNASEYVVSGNSIYNKEKCGDEENKYGISIGANVYNITISENNIYYYGERYFYPEYDTNTYVMKNNNTFNDQNLFFRIIDGATYSLPTINIPELSEPLADGEFFYLKIPSDYTESAVTIIQYNGRPCALYDKANPGEPEGYFKTVIPTEKAGFYAYLKYYIDGTDPKFVLYGYY